MAARIGSDGGGSGLAVAMEDTIARQRPARTETTNTTADTARSASDGRPATEPPFLRGLASHVHLAAPHAFGKAAATGERAKIREADAWRPAPRQAGMQGAGRALR